MATLPEAGVQSSFAGWLVRGVQVRDDFARDYRLTPADRNADESEFFFKPAIIHASG